MPDRRGKYGNHISTYNGVTYHSKREADYARELDFRIMAKELKEWRRQVPVELRVDGMKICTHTIDFVEVDHNRNEMWTEVKGFATPEFRLKWKLFDVLYPEREKQVVN